MFDYKRFLGEWVLMFGVVVGSIWGILEAFHITHDRLSDMLGGYWPVIYVGPVGVGTVVLAIRELKGQSAGDVDWGRTSHHIGGRDIHAENVAGRDVVQHIYELPKDSTQLETIQTGQKSLEDAEESCSVQLGRRHRTFREEYLRFNPWYMARFYGFQGASELQLYERGEKEFPIESIDRLVEFFFVNREYLEGESPFPFRNFNIHAPDEISQLFDEGFHPYFISCPEKRRFLFAYAVFQKFEAGYSRVVVANLVSSFASSGGGRANVREVIYWMIRAGVEPVRTAVLQADKETWCQLERGEFYTKHYYPPALCADHECQDIFDTWYEEVLERPGVDFGLNITSSSTTALWPTSPKRPSASEQEESNRECQ